ncbi:MAG: HEPN domain-containing protein [Bythopirellula sp.]|nr:HEPN domain-containing protein [Bythopirellula sp.]
MDDDISYWLKLAYLDLESAQKSLQGDSFLHCIFGCQQALEKLLKARVVEVTKQSPPRMHNLVRLSMLAGLTLQPHQDSLLSRLSLEYIEMRYPEEFAAIEALNNRPAAEQHLQETQELFAWLEAQRK